MTHSLLTVAVLALVAGRGGLHGGRAAGIQLRCSSAGAFRSLNGRNCRKCPRIAGGVTAESAQQAAAVVGSIPASKRAKTKIGKSRPRWANTAKDRASGSIRATLLVLLP